MEPMYSPARDETAPAFAPAPSPTPLAEDVIPPAFMPGALDMLRERVMRMREGLQSGAPAAVDPAPRRHTDASVDPGPAGEPDAPAAALHAVPDLGAELSRLREILARLESGGGAQLNDAVATLGRKIDLLHAKALDPVAMRRLELQAGELRNAVERALRLQEAADARQAAAEAREAAAEARHKAQQEALAARIAAAEARADANVVPFTEYAGAVREVAKATLTGQQRVEREVCDLRDRLHGLAERIGDLPDEFSAALSDQVDMLLDRVDRPGMDTAALSPLVDVIERHLVALTERVVASHQRLDRLDGIEQALHRISDKVEDLQAASSDASLEAMQAVALRLSARDDAPAVLGLKRGLAALEARQLEFEARTEDFLVREVELELQGLADLGMLAGQARLKMAVGQIDLPPQMEVRVTGGGRAERVRRDAGASASPFAAPDVDTSLIDLDRRIFDGALGDLAAERRAEARTLDWLAAADRAERAERLAPPPARTAHARRMVMLAGRAAVILAAVGLAGVTVLQIARPGTSYARATPGAIPVATKADARVPVQAPDLASLTLPNLPAPLKEAAKAGDPQAAYEVGARLADGRGVDADPALAAKWLAYAAAKGNVPAAYKLGTIYEYSDRNAIEAKRLYAWAAERGNIRAMHNLGVMATEGLDGKADWDGAVHWFRKAAELGLADSQHNLGVIYARGLAGASDLTEAYKWFALAAAQGDTSSGRKRDEVARRSDETTMTRARAMAATFVPGKVDVAANTVGSKPEWSGLASPAAASAPAAAVAAPPVAANPAPVAPVQVAAAQPSSPPPPAAPAAAGPVAVAPAKSQVKSQVTSPVTPSIAAPAAPQAIAPGPQTAKVTAPAAVSAKPVPQKEAPMAAAKDPAGAQEFTFGPPPSLPGFSAASANPRT